MDHNLNNTYFLLIIILLIIIIINLLIINFFRANLGIFCSTPGIPLIRNVSKKVATYMLFTGFSINGKEAYETGLVSKVVPHDKIGKFIGTIK